MTAKRTLMRRYAQRDWPARPNDDKEGECTSCRKMSSRARTSSLVTRFRTSFDDLMYREILDGRGSFDEFRTVAAAAIKD